ncbi:PREDICTED: uncharacterized protein LOC106114305 isoform X2 [Papilio xuthus]|uniref:Uncharacterized protein LOC106114305 isoform X2 n=1 Tax=Papilio xuthus TaxID=66420 RepID=A0AAJ7E4Y2_PAPXU|nr:PREDICTED: uncharacterized protein LOC106114305 isoform X2 [Papilio xuthus]
MSGKAYTIKEMKAIVDYLTEHKAYNEIRGRKMWMDFEKSKVIDRTWQSLKETFLKRILPDIHNPYYQLSVIQISSFRSGYDVEAKLNNKLEIRTVDEESNTNIEQEINSENPSTSNGNASGKKSGEEQKNTKTISQHRSSAETIVLDTCYNTAEDIQKELEGKNDEKKNSSQTTQKSLRDFITYSEPLTPMLQEVIDDFATDEESDSGTRMEIVEDVKSEKISEVNSETTDAPIDISSNTEDDCNEIELPHQSEQNNENNQDSVAKEKQEQIKTGQVTQNATETSVQEISSTEVINVQSSSDIALEQVIIETDKHTEEITTSNNEENIGTQPKQDKSESTKNIEEIAMTQNTTNTTDSTIPNNQEALNTQSEMVSQNKEKESKSTENDKEIASKRIKENKEMQFKSNDSNKRRRASSQDPIASKDKRRLIKNSKPVSVSDTDAGIIKKQKVNGNFQPETERYTKPKAKKIKTSDIEKEIITDKNTKELENVIEINEEEEKEEVSVPTEIITKIHVAGNISPEIENPCLKSVSLYDEEFTSAKYSESSDAGVAPDKETEQKVKKKETNKNNSDNEILQYTSHSESESGDKTPPVRTVPIKPEREKTLDNVFGFTSGAKAHGRKRRKSSRKSAPRHSRTELLSCGSGDWTSVSEADSDSSQRRRKKPKSARLFSLEEDGGTLFLMYGNKVYPVVKDGKVVKKYVKFAQDRDSASEDESYWKLKYMQEKKRTAQLTKLLNESEENTATNERCQDIDLTEASPPKKQKMSIPHTETKPGSSAMQENIPNEPSPEVQKDPVLPTASVVQNKTVKIKITKQNEEVELEGHWSQLHPVLDHVVQIFHKEVEPKLDTKSLSSEQSKVCLSGLSTPIIPHIDQAAHEKVRKLETEIFQEIEARHQENEGSVTPQSTSTDISKVNTRRGRPKRSKMSIESAPSTPDVDKNESKTFNKAEKEQNLEKMASGDVENETSPNTVARRVTRTSKNALRDSTDKSETKINTRGKKGKELIAQVADEDPNVRYKFPSPPPSKKSTRSSASKTTKLTKTKNRYVKTAAPSMDNIILNTIESSQGYQDSDISPQKVIRKRKLRRNTLSTKVRQLSRQNIRRRSQLNYYEMSDQSSNSCPDFGLIKTIQNEGFSSNSDIYRSESLQLLMPKMKKTIGINPNSKLFSAFSEQLDRIINDACKNNEPNSVDKDLHTNVNISNANSSSNISLPTSPVLSIVENLSIDKNSLKSFFDDNINGNQIEESNNNDLFITNEDVTMLLIGQECNQATTNNPDQNNKNKQVTDSILNKFSSVNLNQDNQTISDSLHQKICNLVLESTKKMQPIPKVIEPLESNEMDVDTDLELNKKNRLNKRCSTPLKRQVSKKTKKKNPLMEAFIEEEHTDSCSQSARSCPPLTCNPSGVEYLNPESANVAQKRNTRGRKKKEDVIKVKILRPKARSHSREIQPEQTRNRETKSIHGDSGINETESSILQQLDRSIELIHNHSETCLQTDECLDNSVEYIESNRSFICLLTDSDVSNNLELKDQAGPDSDKNTQCELLIGDNDANILCNVIQTSPTVANNSELILNRESPDSLITEDLSEPEQEQISDRASKWYLLSEDENTNTNFPLNFDFGSDLDKLFPVACAIPNLSTITELSKENDNKPVDPDGDTRNDLLSQSLFDSNF